LPVAAEIIGHFRHTLDTGEPYCSPYFINPRHDVGTIESYEWELHRMALLDGQYGVICYYYDSTKLRAAEAAVRASEDRLRFALESCQIGAWDIDLRDHTALRSSEHDRIFGYQELLTSWTLGDFLKHALTEYRAPVEAMVREATAKKTGWTYECQIRRADGEFRWIWFSGQHRIDSSGRSRVAGVVQDVTERKRAEEALKKANDELERRVAERTAELAQRAAQLRALAGELTLTEQRERGRLAKILHDHLQQLLVAAKFRTTVLGRGGDDVVKRATREVEELIDESIAASRSLTAELSPPILHEAGLDAGLRWLARQMTKNQGLFVDLTLKEDGDLPQDVKILLYESVRELLLNVVKHAHTRSATVNMRRINDHLQVIVSDEGVGFDPTSLPAAGEAGRGFGLFSIRERLELMGGHFEMESSSGHGSQFVLTVPVVPSAEIGPAPSSVVLPKTPLVPSGYFGGCSGNWVFCIDIDQRRRRSILYFQSTAGFPSWTSRVRFPSRAPILSIGYGRLCCEILRMAPF
jgi:PAS domain S-box-containing protein